MLSNLIIIRFMKVRAHRGLPVNEFADECAAKGHTLGISLREDRELELDQDLHQIDCSGMLF